MTTLPPARFTPGKVCVTPPASSSEPGMLVRHTDDEPLDESSSPASHPNTASCSPAAVSSTRRPG